MAHGKGQAAMARGYGAATAGGLLGTLLLATPGLGVGYLLALAFHQPEAGLANLALLIFPAALGGAGMIAGMFYGSRMALRRYGHAEAQRTAALTVPLSVVALWLVPMLGVGLLLAVGVPAGARWLTLRSEGRPAPPA